MSFINKEWLEKNKKKGLKLTAAIVVTGAVVTAIASGVNNYNNSTQATDFMSYTNDDGQIAQLVKFRIGSSTDVKMGYFIKKDEDIYFQEAFTENEINLSYLFLVSSDLDIKYEEVANNVTINQLTQGGLTSDEANEIISNASNFYFDNYMNKYSYEKRKVHILKNTSLSDNE